MGRHTGVNIGEDFELLAHGPGDGEEDGGALHVGVVVEVRRVDAPRPAAEAADDAEAGGQLEATGEGGEDGPPQFHRADAHERAGV